MLVYKYTENGVGKTQKKTITWDRVSRNHIIRGERGRVGRTEGYVTFVEQESFFERDYRRDENCENIV